MRMRVLLAIMSLLAASAVPAGDQTDARLARVLAKTDVRLLDWTNRDVALEFADLARLATMMNERPIPDNLIADTRAAFALFRSAADLEDPAYFVATFLDKSVLSPLPTELRRRYKARYGEEIYPSSICPIVAYPGTGSVAAMLSSALGLPRVFFERVNGDRERFHELFLLTEVSHCGFLAHVLAGDEVQLSVATQLELISLLEAVGDHEATMFFRAQRKADSDFDEADVLYAARVIQSFLGRRPNAYTAIPALLHVFDKHGVPAGMVFVRSALESALQARQAFRTLAGWNDTIEVDRLSLEELGRIAATVGTALASDPERFDGPTRRLLAEFARSVALLSGDRHSLDEYANTPRLLVSLPGFEQQRDEPLARAAFRLR